jgi:hypothetical protein
VQLSIPGMSQLTNLPHKNGFVWVLAGAGGSGKSSLLLNCFKSKNAYRGRFDNVYLFTPEESFTSSIAHPFAQHDKVYHTLSVESLTAVWDELSAKKLASARPKKKKSKKSRKAPVHEDDEDDEDADDEGPPPPLEYSCLIIDDFADAMKDKQIERVLAKMIIKLRHLCCSLIITLQSYLYLPKKLRKQVTNLTVFRPNNVQEWDSVAREALSLSTTQKLQLHDYVFDAPFSHLDVDTRTGALFKNLNPLQFAEKTQK